MSPRKIHLLSALLLVVAFVPASVSTSAAEVAPQRAFSTIEIYLDGGDQPLAAYQLTLQYAQADTRLVGIEGGSTPAFADAPHYDPRALRGGTIKLAAMQLEGPWPTHRVHVATLHVEHSATVTPRLAASQVVAATRNGGAATVDFSYEIGDSP
jgi:hypothetical protein